MSVSDLSEGRHPPHYDNISSKLDEQFVVRNCIKRFSNINVHSINSKDLIAFSHSS